MSDAKHHENGVCLHCGGSVDGDGYAQGGEVEAEREMDEANESAMPEEMGGESMQLREVDRLRDFARSLKGRR